jgi:hypothetical protein
MTPGEALAVPTPSAACSFCRAALVGPYCHACGQGSRAARRSLREVLTGQTGRFVYTLRLLLTQPGELAREIDEARDRRQMRPLTLLLHLIAFFFLVSVLTGFGTRAFVEADPSGSFGALIARHEQSSGLPPAAFRERLEHRFQSANTLLVPVVAIIDGALIGLLYRRARKSWLVPLAAGIQYNCFSYLWLAAWLALLRLLGVRAYGLSPVLLVEFAVAMLYMTLMLRRIYGESLPRTTLNALAVVVVSSIVSNLLLIVALAIALATT